MYDFTQWKDHVTTPANCYKLTQNSDGTYTIALAGTVLQQGTAQDQIHFNNIESGIVDAHIAAGLLMNAVRQNSWEKESGEITLTNTYNYPFNNSAKTVSLSNYRENGDYVVLTEVSAFDGNVGDIVISDKLNNGFKIAFNGSAKSATIKYTVIGGYMK